MARDRKKEANKNKKKTKPGLFKRIKRFFGDIRGELRRVSWPDKKRLKLNTATVVSIILISALIIFIFDSLISLLLTKTGFYHVKESDVATPPPIEGNVDPVPAPPVDNDAPVNP